MKRALTTLSAMPCIALVSAAQTAYTPPAPGTMITWSYKFDDAVITKLSQVVATGEDFVIYDADLRYDTGQAGDYLVEFSGLHAQACDRPLLSARDRAGLAALWPLKEGAATSVSGEAAAMYVVGRTDAVHFISNQSASNEVRQIYGTVGDGDNSLNISVSTAYGIPVQITWNAGGYGQVLEIVEPQGSADIDDFDPDALGYCAELVR